MANTPTATMRLDSKLKDEALKYSNHWGSTSPER